MSARITEITVIAFWGRGGGSTEPDRNTIQRAVQSGVVVVGNTNPSGNGQNGNCYFSEGVNPAVTCNKNEGNRVAIPVLTPDRAVKMQNGRRFKDNGEESFMLTTQDIHGVAVEVKGLNVTANRIRGGVTDTALALQSRDYKGLGTNQQFMTVAAMCLQPTKDTSSRKGNSQTASKPEKTED